MSKLKKAIGLSSALLLSACVVQPNVVNNYDERCHVVKKKVELSVEQLEFFGALDCSDGRDCKDVFISEILGSAVVFPVSAIVSGSIALVGNTVFWLQEQGQCLSDKEANSNT
ncbi:hypothetical protein [Psychrobium sp. 1_MG-2023]|uniref:hypothetical protein n=1 Tax=Psychrobium sp. 1_MG-2023 TaxID=3062624 RepID=UPI000C3343CE|nr:hypothetical protein [Psychrobium sp. 1_MG-2023]MDP2561083.1 hypothetical protein [Psychrobium sp. 1_MG-2023]PKF58372.1 hypothetical protein CW748_04215 [Alteromonadales bacterium alter-6D02]